MFWAGCRLVGRRRAAFFGFGNLLMRVSKFLKADPMNSPAERISHLRGPYK